MNTLWIVVGAVIGSIVGNVVGICLAHGIGLSRFIHIMFG